MRKYLFFTCFLLATGLLNSCGLVGDLKDIKEGVDEQVEDAENGEESDEGENDEGEDNLILNISGAVSLAVVEEIEEGRSSNLFKMVADGSFQEVSFVLSDAEGNETLAQDAKVRVREVEDLNEDFLILVGEFSVKDNTGQYQYYNSLLVQKSNGKYTLLEEELYRLYNRLGNQAFQSDAAGDFYFLTSDHKVKKLSINNLDDITVASYLSTGQEAQHFMVDAAGNCIYNYGESAGTQGNGTEDLRIRKANGGIAEVKIEGEDNLDYWLGSNGNFYFATYTWDNGSLPTIYRIDILNDEVSFEKVWKAESTESNPGVGSLYTSTSQGHHRIRKDNSSLFIDTYGAQYSDISRHWEFFEATNTVQNITTLPAVAEGSIIVRSDNYYYIATGSELYKVDINSHQATKLLNEGDFEIYSMAVDPNDNLQFSGLRFSDGKQLLVKVDAANNAQAFDPGMSSEFIVLKMLK